MKNTDMISKKRLVEMIKSLPPLSEEITRKMFDLAGGDKDKEIIIVGCAAEAMKRACLVMIEVAALEEQEEQPKESNELEVSE